MTYMVPIHQPIWKAAATSHESRLHESCHLFGVLHRSGIPMLLRRDPGLLAELLTECVSSIN